MSPFAQDGFRFRFDWGRHGVEQLAPVSDVRIVVDVLSLSTAVDVAASRGAIVIPYHLHDNSAAAFAQRQGAELAVGRSHASTDHPFSLSPDSLARLKRGTKIVLPSANGAAMSIAANDKGCRVLTGCLRNAEAVADKAKSLGGTVAVIGAGELWKKPGSPLRPAFEDLIGAGAVLTELGADQCSPEARAAVAAFQAVGDNIEPLLLDCASGRELDQIGFRGDVRAAAQINVSRAAPLLEEGAFVDSAAGT